MQQAILKGSLGLDDALFLDDMIATVEGVPTKYLSEILKLIFHERLTPFPRKENEKGSGFQSSFRPGWVHLGVDKLDLQKQTRTSFVRTYSTLLQYAKQGYQYMTLGTFNVKKRVKWERNRRQINSVRAFVIDIDSKKWPIKTIIEFCAGYGLMPSFINETIRGYHVWFVLEQDFVGPHERNKELTKVGALYNEINRLLIALFEKGFPGAEDGTDQLVGGERYIRIPRNIAFYSGKYVKLKDLLDLKKNLKRDASAGLSRKVAMKGKLFIPQKALREDPAWNRLMTLEPNVGKRRYTAFTIALLFYAMGWTEEQASGWLEQWFEALGNKKDFSWREVSRSIKVAFSGKFNGPSNATVRQLTGIKPKVYFTRRKRPEERIYQTQSHWEELFISMLVAKDGKWVISNRELCEVIGLSSRAMLEKIVQSLVQQGLIQRTVKGQGRGAETCYTYIQPNVPDKDKKVVQLERYRPMGDSPTKEHVCCKNDPESYMPLSLLVDGGRGRSLSSDFSSSTDHENDTG